MLENVKAWAASPFRSDMSALQWFIFFGFLIAVSLAWKLILVHVAREV